MLAAMPQEHERAAGGWQAEWTTMPELVRLTLQSAEAIADALSRLDVDPARMRDNLQRGGGMAMSEALAAVVSQYLPRQDAAALVERLSRAAERDRRSLRDVATEDVEIRRWLSAADIEAVLTPDNYLGSAAVFVERVLQRWSL
jgi:3-carboxy-cis,cis-muconate cycloisomerase